MSSQRYSLEFKDESVRQIIKRCYSVAEVFERLGVSSYSLYQWIKAIKLDKTEQQTAELVEARSEVLRLRVQLRNQKRSATSGCTRVFHDLFRRSLVSCPIK